MSLYSGVWHLCAHVVCDYNQPNKEQDDSVWKHSCTYRGPFYGHKSIIMKLGLISEEDAELGPSAVDLEILTLNS